MGRDEEISRGPGWSGPHRGTFGTLAGVRWHQKDRTPVYGNKTVVFDWIAIAHAARLRPDAGGGSGAHPSGSRFMNARLLLVLAMAAVITVGWVGAFVLYRAAEVGELVSPLAPQQWDRLTVITVGTGGGYENPERMGPSTALAWADRVVLVDVGRGVPESLRRAKIPVTQPSIVLLTNLLPLNTMGLDDLVFTGWLLDREQPLRVIGPVGTEAFVRSLLAAHASGREALGASLPLPSAGADVEVTEVDGGWSEEIDGVVVRAGALPGGPLPALAWRFERGRTGIVVSGTGWNEDALVEFARDADMLVHEGVYIPPTEDLEDAGVEADPLRLEREAAVHTSLLEVGELASRAGVDSLALVRLRPPPFFAIQISMIVSETFEGRILIPEDGDSIIP
jgi:ribonuclease BN (tRNA processing enzyme)